MKMSGSAKSRREFAAERSRVTLESARAAGLLGGAKSARVAGRVPAQLVVAAKKSAGVSSDTEVIEVALARLALEDDFGSKLVGGKGSVTQEIVLDV
jgi:hypothetical protein